MEMPTPDPALFLGQSPEFSERRLMAEAPVPGKTAKTRKTPRNQRISRRWRNSSFRTRSGLQSSPLLKPDLSAHFQWRTSRGTRSVVLRPRFIFVGNQPFSVNGEAMELLGRGCRIMNPDELRNRLGIWRWRMHATWELLIAWCNSWTKAPHQTPSRGGVPAVMPTLTQ